MYSTHSKSRSRELDHAAFFSKQGVSGAYITVSLCIGCVEGEALHCGAVATGVG
jgi:hypothetical protein